MKQFLLQKEELLSQAGYVTNLQVGLFEFIAPTGIFISFDSGTNPE
jgi:hypothetical protein